MKVGAFMKKAEIEPKLAEIMDTIPECEGLIAVDAKGKVVAGQTLTDLDLGEIANAMKAIVSGAGDLGGVIKKGETLDVQVSFNEGFAQVTVGGAGMIIGIMGNDGRNSLSLLMRNMKTVVS
jgi:predicted regulator of Ras-like GTPase activity (Roadblock/LC7/MglB family)